LRDFLFYLFTKETEFPQFPCLFLSVYFCVCVCVLSRSLDARGNPEGKNCFVVLFQFSSSSPASLQQLLLLARLQFLFLIYIYIYIYIYRERERERERERLETDMHNNNFVFLSIYNPHYHHLPSSSLCQIISLFLLLFCKHFFSLLLFLSVFVFCTYDCKNLVFSFYFEKSVCVFVALIYWCNGAWDF